ncbi:MAG TPA: hypothetical protein VLE45_15165 [Burkholderiaceae bacterium]|nr:hypothetical protein [Burkholderiaceae bacterium]
MKPLTALGLLCLSSLALAHEGHGLGAMHWHATDTLGFVALGAIVAAALWASRRK